ncbi:MAG TPA: YkvA family protein [Xanthobacteraceae bacterium]|nr:YkvA family protein [Xanthobacteraceae bacterium]
MSFGQHTASWAEADALARRLAAEERDIRHGFWSKLRGLAAHLPFAEDLIAAHYCAFDRQTPMHVKAALFGALAYFVLPTDAIPDVLPVIGYTDDAAVLAAAINLVASHLTPDHREAARRALARLRAEA